jgi:tRNA threonylcarbamoyladenosine biosynthesis protein TsaB
VTILALSTSTPHASVALVEGDRVLASLAYDDPRGHAERIFALVDDVLVSAGRARADVRLVACDIGPGSFTGVRIAVASAKGIALGLGVPLAGVVSLEAMAAGARSSCRGRALVAAAIDAKKDELYVAVYDGQIALVPPSHVPVAEVAARVASAIQGRPFVSVVDAAAFVGFAPGAERALVAPPEAEWIGRLAAARDLGQPAADPAADVAPLYVRAPDAIPAFSGPPGAFAMLPPR